MSPGGTFAEVRFPILHVSPTRLSETTTSTREHSRVLVIIYCQQLRTGYHEAIAHLLVTKPFNVLAMLGINNSKKKKAL
jgi:hypothetical protein